MKRVIVDHRIPESAYRALMLSGFTPISLPTCKYLPEAISSHPDTLIFKLGNTIITYADYCEEASYVFSDIREWCPDITVRACSDTPGNIYPNDCSLNALRIGKYLFLRKESISSSVLSLAEAEGLSVVNVKQGYSACSTLALGEGAAITADCGMARAMRECGIKVYEIEEGHISLPPHEYGFIGGAGGVCDDKIYFYGDYRTHPSAEIIKRAADDLSYKIVPLSDSMLSDFGGMIFL